MGRGDLFQMHPFNAILGLPLGFERGAQPVGEGVEPYGCLTLGSGRTGEMPGILPVGSMLFFRN